MFDVLSSEASNQHNLDAASFLAWSSDAKSISMFPFITCKQLDTKRTFLQTILRLTSNFFKCRHFAVSGSKMPNNVRPSELVLFVWQSRIGRLVIKASTVLYQISSETSILHFNKWIRIESAYP